MITFYEKIAEDNWKILFERSVMPVFFIGMAVDYEGQVYRVIDVVFMQQSKPCYHIFVEKIKR